MTSFLNTSFVPLSRPLPRSELVFTNQISTSEYPLSPAASRSEALVELTGIEPVTSGLQSRRSPS